PLLVHRAALAAGRRHVDDTVAGPRCRGHDAGARVDVVVGVRPDQQEGPEPFHLLSHLRPISGGGVSRKSPTVPPAEEPSLSRARCRLRTWSAPDGPAPRGRPGARVGSTWPGPAP